MKKMICVILALMFLLAGCRAPGGETTPPAQATDPAGENQLQLGTVPTLPVETIDPGPVMGGLSGDELPFANAGKVEIRCGQWRGWYGHRGLKGESLGVFSWNETNYPLESLSSE